MPTPYSVTETQTLNSRPTFWCRTNLLRFDTDLLEVFGNLLEDRLEVLALILELLRLSVAVLFEQQQFLPASARTSPRWIQIPKCCLNVEDYVNIEVDQSSGWPVPSIIWELGIWMLSGSSERNLADRKNMHSEKKLMILVFYLTFLFRDQSWVSNSPRNHVAGPEVSPEPQTALAWRPSPLPPSAGTPGGGPIPRGFVAPLFSAADWNSSCNIHADMLLYKKYKY